MKQQEAVQRVVQLEEQLDRLEVERSDLSHRLQQMTQSGAGTSAATDPLKADDSASEVGPRSPSLPVRERAASELVTMTRSHLPPCHRVHEIKLEGLDIAPDAQVFGGSAATVHHGVN